MYKIALASYINKKPIHKAFFSNIIELQQRLQGYGDNEACLTHSEAMFYYVKDKDVLRRIQALKNMEVCIGGPREICFKKFNLWFSSSERDKGSRFKFIDDDKGNWRYDIIEVSKEQYVGLLDYYISINNLPYAYWSIVFTQGFKTLWFDRDDKFFCSEAVLTGFQKVLHIMCGVSAVTINPVKLVEGIQKHLKKTISF